MLASWELGGELREAVLLFICIAPGLVWGLIEDLTKRGAVLVRLALSAVAAAAGFVLLDARIAAVDVAVIDYLLQFHAVSFAFTLVAVAGVANAINLIDGLNGLSGISALVASIGLAVVAWTVGDAFVFNSACLLAASVAGFLVVNFPSGRIFLGDGGAYLVGLLLAELSVILVHRNVEVSPWFPLVLLAYPVWETLFSMYRRQTRGRSTGSADALHLHTLVYRRIVRWKGPRASAAEGVLRNSLASLCLWNIPMIACGIALAFWDRSLVLQCAALGFALLYVVAYRRIVRFRVPAWMVLRAERAEPLDAEAIALNDPASAKIR
jgi:UDP-N-acetylmuramyl pentapeptide phosphotransferase/UDP-N-acetylglucosamine-1-phosphate transferase